MLKKQSVIIAALLSLILTACDVSRIGSLIEVKNQAEQFDKMIEELSDLKEIKVKNIPLERYKKTRDIIYDKYFVHNKEDDKKYIIEESSESNSGMCYELRYEKDKEYEMLVYRDNYIQWTGDNMSSDYKIEEIPDEKIMEKEVEKLFQLFDLPLGNSENGYMIDTLSIDDDNTGTVVLKRYMEGKELSTMPSLFPDIEEVENIMISFAGNKIVGIDITGLAEEVTVVPYKNDVLVNDPQKAHKIIDDYIRSTTSSYIATEQGMVKKEEEELVIERARITYVVQSQEDGVSILYPMAEFETQERTYHIDLTTKEVIEC